MGRLTVALLSCLALPLAACLVPQKRYDAAVANANAQHNEIVTLQTSLDQCEERRTRAREQLEDAEASARVVEDARSGLELDLTVTRRERDNAQLLVDQLRGELARVGRDVRTFAGRNAQLSESLQQLESRVEGLARAERVAEERTEVFSELALALRADLAQRIVDLELVSGQPVVTMLPAGANAGGLSGGGLEAVRIVGRVVATHPSGRVQILLSPLADRVLAEPVSKALVVGGLDATRISLRGPQGEPRHRSPLRLVIDLADPRTEIEQPR